MFKTLRRADFFGAHWFFHFLHSFPKRYNHISFLFGKAIFAVENPPKKAQNIDRMHFLPRSVIGAKKKERKDMRNNQINVPQAKQAMEQFKMQAAQEVGVNLTNGYNGHLTSREAGSVGGQMVKKMIEAYEQGMQ